MSIFRRYSQAGGAVHDLEHIAGLSLDRTVPLLVSPRVLYVLQNLASQDIAFECRWAVSLETNGYLRLTTDDAEYSTFVDVVSEIGYQLSENQVGMGTLPNFKEPLVASALNQNASAGTNTLSLQPPEGEIWKVEFVAALDVNTPITAMIFTAGIVGGNDAWLDRRTSPAAGIYQILRGPVTLANESQIVVVFEGCSAGDDLYLRAYGYIMDRVA